MSSADITGRLARYMVEARSRTLPTEVAREGNNHGERERTGRSE